MKHNVYTINKAIMKNVKKGAQSQGEKDRDNSNKLT